MGRTDAHLFRMPTPFRTTLWRVLLIQAITLALLGAMQARYHLGTTPPPAAAR